ncbi:MAG: tripartite tricarboxylate transporter TctB family protein [Sneathiella sp.]|nr:tripartite tricarboxylate transporter TctB family protein [Sneathiella sp.]
MTLDKYIAVLFLTVSIIYGYSAYTYPLLPFELNMVFLPNTMPLALSVLGILISGIIIISGKSAPVENTSDTQIDISRLRDYKLGQAAGLLTAMFLYALLLRPLGFIPATVMFLVGCGWVLGERKLHIMLASSLIGAGTIWYLVQEVLGIF